MLFLSQQGLPKGTLPIEVRTESEALKKLIPIIEKYGQQVFPPDYLD